MDIKILSINLLFLFLSGCAGIGGYWMNGNPSVGENITPSRDFWFLSGASAQIRSKDWVECGGWPTGRYASSVVLPSESELSAKERSDIGKKKDEKTVACMLNKGYRYTGLCQIEKQRYWQDCRERTLDKFLPWPKILLEIK